MAEAGSGRLWSRPVLPPSRGLFVQKRSMLLNGLAQACPIPTRFGVSPASSAARCGRGDTILYLLATERRRVYRPLERHRVVSLVS